MPKQNAPSKPPHRTAHRKSKPKFDVPEGVGEPSAASWVYREDSPAAPNADRAPVTTVEVTPVAAIAETLAAPIAAAIEATASIAPEPARLDESSTRPRPDAYYQTRESVHDVPPPVSRNILQAAAMGVVGVGLGMFDFFATTTLKLAAIPFGIARRLMPD